MPKPPTSRFLICDRNTISLYPYELPPTEHNLEVKCVQNLLGILLKELLTDPNQIKTACCSAVVLNKSLCQIPKLQELSNVPKDEYVIELPSQVFAQMSNCATKPRKDNAHCPAVPFGGANVISPSTPSQAQGRSRKRTAANASSTPVRFQGQRKPRTQARHVHSRSVLSHQHIKNGNTAQVYSWIQRPGASPQMILKDGSTPLHFACELGQYNTAEVLLDNGAPVDQVPPASKCKQGWAPLMVACEHGQKDLAALLLQYGADVNLSSANGTCALHFACQEGHAEVVELLLEHNANAHRPNKLGNTPLDAACTSGSVEVAKLLIENYANVNDVDKDGDSVLSNACAEGHTKVVELLLKEGAIASVNRLNNEGMTPLHRACCHGHKAVVALLLKNGASLSSVSKDGKTPMHIAREKGHKEIVDLLYHFERINAHPSHAAPMAKARKRLGDWDLKSTYGVIA